MAGVLVRCGGGVRGVRRHGRRGVRRGCHDTWWSAIRIFERVYRIPDVGLVVCWADLRADVLVHHPSGSLCSRWAYGLPSEKPV